MEIDTDLKEDKTNHQENHENSCEGYAPTNGEEGNVPQALSKNAMRKKLRWEKIKEKHKAMRHKRKLEKRARTQDTPKETSALPLPSTSTNVSKKERIQSERKRLLAVLENSSCTDGNDMVPHPLHVCIDLQFGDKMSDKELSHLASQLCRVYGANKSNETPAKLSLLCLDESGRTFKTCEEKNNGFANYIWHRTAKPLIDEYSSEIHRLVYLTPDSPVTLKELESDKIYVIGGLVDDSVQKNTTFKYATANKISTARLPIEGYCSKKANGKYTFKKILTINQVFDILKKFYECKDWGTAFKTGIPERVGYMTIK